MNVLIKNIKMFMSEERGGKEGDSRGRDKFKEGRKGGGGGGGGGRIERRKNKEGGKSTRVLSGLPQLG